MEVRKYPDTDALYLKLRDTQYQCGRELDDGRHLLLDVNGDVLGVSFMYVSEGVDLDGIPSDDVDTVSRLLREANVKIRSVA